MTTNQTPSLLTVDGLIAHMGNVLQDMRYAVAHGYSPAVTVQEMREACDQLDRVAGVVHGKPQVDR